MRRLLSKWNRWTRFGLRRACEADAARQGLALTGASAVSRATRNLALALCVFLSAAVAAWAESKTIARCGEGFLEEVDGYRVLHVAGQPYEMGYQQGALLRDHVRDNVRFLFDVKAKEAKIEVAGFKLLDAKRVIAGIIAQQRKHIPERFFDEMRGIADGSGVDLDEIQVANFIPELFHCSGFALAGAATKDGTLYHGRILDYGCDWKLQEHAVLTIGQPRGHIPFVNVTYAGFVGSVTGMNAERISIGEMGGRGLGHWEGTPMALLVRMALEEADTLERAIAVFRDRPRTCEYYYVIADGESRKAVGMEASWNVFGVIGMGESHPRLPHAFKDAVLLSAGDRYQELVKRVEKGYGHFDADSARQLMDRPVAMKSNLHSVLFETTTTRFWVANASKDKKPAAEQPYHAFQLTELLKHRPDQSAPALPNPPAAPPRAASRSTQPAIR
jgi:isopenicillin-N N-acyltransferase-like protein